MKALIAMTIVLAAIVFGPFLLIWALNTLFPVVAIPYTLETWFASIIIGGIFKVQVSK